MVQSLNGSQGL